MTIALARPVGTTDPTTLVGPDVTERLVHHITAEHPEIDDTTARRIVGQAAAFVAASGSEPGQALAPSKLVDIGWHAFILHTVAYAAFCDRVVGRFVHHVPTDENDEPPGGHKETRQRTLAAIEAAGYTADPELWGTSASCSQCHAGCHDSPKNA